jgi:hypothetical protein
MEITDTTNFIEELKTPIISISQSSLEEALQVWDLEDSPTDHRDYIMGSYAYDTEEEWSSTKEMLGLPKDCERPNYKFIILTRG